MTSYSIIIKLLPILLSYEYEFILPLKTINIGNIGVMLADAKSAKNQAMLNSIYFIHQNNFPIFLNPYQ